MKKISYTIVVLLFLTSFAHANSPETQELQNYIQKLINEGYNNFNNDSLSNIEKKRNSKHLIRSNLDLNWMADYTLGRNKRTLSKEELEEFHKVYSKFVVTAYTELSTYYNGEKTVIKDITKIDDKMFMANLEIISPDGQPPIKVNYLIHVVNDKQNPYRIADIITEGISTLNSQQAEFNSVISRKGIGALISDLRTRIDSSKEVIARYASK